MKKQSINIRDVTHLIATQFPQWKNLDIKPVQKNGWDNNSFRLGEDKLIRLPSSQDYAPQVQKEQTWLPKLAPHLPLSIPKPIAMGAPCDAYPYHWSVYQWIDGDIMTDAQDLNVFAKSLAVFLNALQQINTENAPKPSTHNFYRGGDLKIYNEDIKTAIAKLSKKIDCFVARQIWQNALDTTWQNPAVWLHGDIQPDNCLVQNRQLTAIIDFGLCAVGDPACDLAIAWSFLKNDSRQTFKEALKLDEHTWLRGKAWALWKALIVAAGICDSNENHMRQALQTLKALRLTAAV